MSTVAAPPRRTRPVDPPPTTGSRVSLVWVLLTSLAIVGYVYYTYAAGSLDTLAEEEAGLASTYADRAAPVQVAFYAHIVFSALALAIGPLQFVRALRRRRPAVHRWIGRVFLGSVALGAAASFVMAFVNSAAINGFFGFGTLALLWGYTAWRGWRAARVGDYAGHQAWMIRCFALTYAGVTLRVWLGVLIGVQLLAGTGADGDVVVDTAYAALPFLSWLPNLVVGELLVRRRGLPALRMTPGEGAARSPRTEAPAVSR
jgi:uncharacterized membrane protein